MAAPLAKFMKKLNGLPESVKNSYEEIVDLDQRCIEKRKRLAGLCRQILIQPHQPQQSSKKSLSKAKDSKKKRYTEAMELLTDMQQIATEKLQLASECYEEVDRYIIELDKAYGKFAQNVSGNLQVDKKHSNKVLNSNRKKKSRLQDVVETDATTDSIEFDSPLVEMPVDPNEPTYCLCHQVSFGQMICCDNKNCVVEWFHFNCVGLLTTPKGKWYCEACREKMSKRGRKSTADKK